MKKEADITNVEELMPMVEEFFTTDSEPQPDALIVVEDQPEQEKDFDWEKNKNPKKFIDYLKKKLNNLPKHSGQTTAGCERIMSYLKQIDKEISKMMQDPDSNDLDDQEVEGIRKQLRKDIKKVQKRHNEINDAYDADDNVFASDETVELVKSAEADGLYCSVCGTKANTKDEQKTHVDEKHPKKDVTFSSTKTAEDDKCPKCEVPLWKITAGTYECISCDELFERPLKKEAGTAKLTLVMDPFQRAITGAIINSFVCHGKNIEETYAALKDKYKFTPRDELALMQVLSDMGHPAMLLKDRGHIGDESEQLNKGMGIEFSTQYNA